jgi:hypothetical protein
MRAARKRYRKIAITLISLFQTEGGYYAVHLFIYRIFGNFDRAACGCPNLFAQ